MDVAGIEPATPCLQSGKPNLSNLAGADVTRLDRSSYDRKSQTVFSFFFRLLFAKWPDLPRLVRRSYYAHHGPVTLRMARLQVVAAITPWDIDCFLFRSTPTLF